MTIDPKKWEKPESWPQRLARLTKGIVAIVVTGAALVGGLSFLGVPVAEHMPEPVRRLIPKIDTAAASEAPQAQAIDTVLELSSASRKKIQTAVGQVQSCTGLTSGIKKISEVRQERGDQLARAQRLRVDALPNGNALKATLVKALSASARGNKFYLRWAQQYAAHGCVQTAEAASVLRSAEAASFEASEAKKKFIALWGKIAKENGLKLRSSWSI